MPSTYAVIYEQGDHGWGAWVPDLPGCIAAASTRREAERLIGEAVSVHIESLREAGEPVPQPSSATGEIDGP